MAPQNHLYASVSLVFQSAVSSFTAISGKYYRRSTGYSEAFNEQAFVNASTFAAISMDLGHFCGFSL
jgi:hypothetical protein